MSEARHSIAGYLKRRRTHAILACFLLVSVLLVAFSGVDIQISKLFFDDGFQPARQGWVLLLQQAVNAFIVVSMTSVVGLYAVNRLWKRNVLEIDGRKVAYVFLVLIVGCGLIVNVALKDNFGRARPRDIAEFGGAQQFTPAFVIADGCSRNCSFSSGDAAGAFFALAFIPLARRKRLAAVAGLGFGILVSVSRIASGAHFFSDTVVSFFVMVIVADGLHYFMFQPEPGPIGSTPAPEPGILAGEAGKSLP